MCLRCVFREDCLEGLVGGHQLALNFDNIAIQGSSFSLSPAYTLLRFGNGIVNLLLFFLFFPKLAFEPLNHFAENGFRCIWMVDGSTEFAGLSFFKLPPFDGEVLVFKGSDMAFQMVDVLP